MEDKELRKKIIETAYQTAKEQGGIKTSRVNIWDLAKKWGVDKKQMEFNVDYLHEKGFIEYAALGGFIRITALGVDQVEE